MQEKDSQNAIIILNNLKVALNIVSDKDLSSVFGVKPNTISTWRTRDSIDYSVLFAVCEQYNLDLNTIVLNRKSQIEIHPKECIALGEKNCNINCNPNCNPLDKTVTEKQEHTKIGSENIDYRLVPLYNFDAVGGSVNAEVDSVQYIEGYVPFLEAKSDDICMHVTGRSMLPTYAAGTIVLLHPVYRWREFLEYGEIYVIDLQDERRLIKEIRRSNDNCRENFLLFSHNPDYDPIDIPKDLINKVWLVKAIYQKTTM